MQQQFVLQQQLKQMVRGPRPQQGLPGGIPPQQQRPQMPAGVAPAGQQQNPYQAHQKNYESASQNQHPRPYSHQQNSQYRPKPRNNAPRGNQYQQQSYQKKGTNTHQQQQYYQPRPAFNQQMFPVMGGAPVQPMMPLNQPPPMMQPPAPYYPGPMVNQQPLMNMPLQPVPLVLVNIQELNALATNDEKKNYIGELVYEFIEQKYPNDAPKIAGMLLDQGVDLMLTYCANKAVFYGQVDTAYKMLNASPQ